jgi:hypothetical protein
VQLFVFVFLLACVVGVVGVGYLVSALVVGRGSALFRDRLFVGTVLLMTAVGLGYIGLRSGLQGDALYSGIASSVSAAPGP